MLLLVWTLHKDGVSVNSANSETENVNESYCCHCTCVSQTQVALPPSNKCSLLSAVWPLEILKQGRLGSKAQA